MNIVVKKEIFPLISGTSYLGNRFLPLMCKVYFMMLNLMIKLVEKTLKKSFPEHIREVVLIQLFLAGLEAVYSVAWQINSLHICLFCVSLNTHTETHPPTHNHTLSDFIFSSGILNVSLFPIKNLILIALVLCFYWFELNSFSFMIFSNLVFHFDPQFTSP